ncbi:MAG: hypothetical protein R2779_08110 [Crocinitomicaceae bacterium]
MIAKKGDTYFNWEFEMTLGQIENYNDVKNGNTTIKEGDIINIHPKHAKGKKKLIKHIHRRFNAFANCCKKKE